MLEMVLSLSFYSISEVRLGMPYPTVSNLKYWFVWYLLLKLFIRTSFPARNSLSLVFKVRALRLLGILRS